MGANLRSSERERAGEESRVVAMRCTEGYKVEGRALGGIVYNVLEWEGVETEPRLRLRDGTGGSGFVGEKNQLGSGVVAREVS